MRRLTCLVLAAVALAATATARGAETDAKPIATRAEPEVKPEPKPDSKPASAHGAEGDAKAALEAKPSEIKPSEIKPSEIKPSEIRPSEIKPSARHACLAAAETREEIKERRLREPYAVLKFAAQHFKAEALSARLCRIDDEFVYEIALLNRDGKFVHAHVNATTGKLVEMKRAAAPPPKN